METFTTDLAMNSIFREPVRPSPLSPNEAKARFVEHFEPLAKAALNQPTLLSRWHLGAAFNFGREHRIDLLLNPESQKPPRLFFMERLGLEPHKARQEVSVACQIASGLHLSWIELQPEVAISTALQIVRGKPYLADWICHILYKQALGPLYRAADMASVRSKLLAELLSWPELHPPSPEQILLWIGTLRRGEPIVREERRNLDRGVERTLPASQNLRMPEDSAGLLHQILGQVTLQSERNSTAERALLACQQALEACKAEVLMVTKRLTALEQGIHPTSEPQPEAPSPAQPEPQEVPAQSTAEPESPPEPAPEPPSRPQQIPANKPSLTRATKPSLDKAAYLQDPNPLYGPPEMGPVPRPPKEYQASQDQLGPLYGVPAPLIRARDREIRMAGSGGDRKGCHPLVEWACAPHLV